MNRFAACVTVRNRWLLVTPLLLLALAASAHAESVAIADLNGDGRPDLATARIVLSGQGILRNMVTVQLGNGDGTFAPGTDIDTGSQAPGLSVAFADVNADGRLDLAVALLGGSVVLVMLGNGDGTFVASNSEFSTGRGLGSLAIADLNADGRPDLATANEYSSTASVLLGNGDGTFGTKTDFGTDSYPYSVAIADLNADGRLDLATANYWSNTVSVLLGNGDGTFAPNSDFGTGWGPASVAIADLNADGRPDLATANAGANTVSVLLGNGDGSFGAKTDFGTGRAPKSVAIADLNADGQPDLAVANFFSSTLSVLLGNGDGTFAPKSDFTTDGTTSSVAIADLNADGRPDLAAANSYPQVLSVLLGNGDGTFRVKAACPLTSMSFAFSPNTLNSRSRAQWVTATLEPEPPASPADIDISSIRLNHSVPVDPSAPTSIGDVDGDGRPDLTVKFSRMAVEPTVPEGDAVPVTVSGTIGGGCFDETELIRVMRVLDSRSAGESRTFVPAAEAAPAWLTLQDPYPNPAGGPIGLRYGQPREGKILLRIFDIHGRRVARLAVGSHPAGWATASWDGRSDLGKPAPSGVYFAIVEGTGGTARRKFVLVR